MNQIFEKNFIPTKEAAELSGYTSDYLARLARSGKISARRVGHTWMVDSESLTSFLDQQGDRKVDYARALARAREKEYRALNSPVQQVTKTLTKPIEIPEKLGIVVNTFRSHALAISLSFAVVISGAMVARASAIPLIANQIAHIAGEINFGFNETFGNIPSRIAERIGKAGDDMRSNYPRVAENISRASTNIVSPILTGFNIDSLQMAVADNQRKPNSISSKSTTSFSVTPITFENLQKSVRSAYEFFTSPSHITRAYQEVGKNIYDAISSSFSGYHSLIENSGIKTLSLAVSARDTIATAPRFVSEFNLSFGNAIIGMTQKAIHADTMFAYSLAEMAPRSAGVTVALLGEIGSVVADNTSRIPSLASNLFLRTTEVPAHIAPAIASSVFNAEYGVSKRFVKDTQAIRDNYLGAVNMAGRIYHDSSLALQNIGEVGPSAIQDAYLATLGKSAMALHSFAKTPKVAAVLNSPPMRALQSAGEAGLAAIEPVLTTGERVAFVTYKTVRGWLDSTNRALAVLFGPPPSIVLPSGAPRTRVLTVETSSKNNQTPGTSYPTYTTVVRGVSEDFVNQSLASLRADILATTAGLVRPVYNQTVTNAATTQIVNKIEDLSNLIVRNGDFRGGVFDNGERVSAKTGTFTTLNGGATALASTTITGDLSVSGTITPGIIAATNYISAPYFIATSTTATSTFAGSFAIDTNGFVYATTTKNVGIGILSPAALLAIQNSTSTQPIFVASSAAGAEVYRITNAGFVGIGTTTPGYALAVEGSSSLGNQAIAGYFTATSTTATSTFAGVLAIGTTTPFRNGLFTVGTSTPLLYIERNSGRIGVGTSTPSVAFDVYATDAIRLPVGTSAQRPSTGDVGYVRFNTTTHQFEGYGDNAVWQGLGGVIDADQDTYVTADTNNADEDTLRFFTFGTQRMTITPAGNIGVASTSPYAKFSIHANAGETNTTLFSIAS
ncbi:MAG: helix-turn-helix domain-containing protein, partial [bacterium]|nr:helix-turn-helix domain-containing protein [bacterium]